ncbi:SPOR domain-containing protein [Ochrobactrum sp. Marseille-Q0166]|uniref:SPOR domain-containing protein n=1 Tax=Ochrobactrum sp. Marseille-Q0166 TaxID=2761105 RepID=UPI001655A17F|nr:SPOR domain-containing protein [Ochrobactrum sp. Marseille-Q0166]MBC8717576.1 SPOR domain-containing protein [Ochrobactrum sp. Marseille-Q0166]
MTDSSANSRNYGDRPLHEDDPLMELSRIMDFGASADTNIPQNDYRGDFRSEPNFDSGDSELSFDLERELLGDFGNEAEPQQYTVPFSTNSYQNEEPVLNEDNLASALEEEFDFQLDSNEPAVSAQSFEFVEADRAEPVPQFDYNDYSEARTAYEDIHPDVYAANASVAASEQSHSSFPVSEYQASETAFSDPYTGETARYPANESADSLDVNQWEIPSATTFEPSQSIEPAHHALSLEDELESLLFGDEPQTVSEPEPDYRSVPQGEPQQYANYGSHFDADVVEGPAYAEPAFDDFSSEEPQAYAPVESPMSYVQAGDHSETSSQQDAPAHPHYTLSNFAAGAATTGALSPESVPQAAEYESEQSEFEDDFSFGDDFSLADDTDVVPAVAESTDDDLSGLEEISFGDDDFGFEPSGESASAVTAEAAATFTEDVFFTDEDFDLEAEAEEESVSQPAYAHATYSDEEQRPSAPTFGNYADQRSAFAAPAPEIETLSVAEGKVEQTHSLDLPEVSYGDDDSNASLNDLEAEFAEVFSTIDVEESTSKAEVQSEADKAFEDIFRESASSYLPNGGVATGAALGLGAAAATVAYGRANPTVQSTAPQKTSGSSDDFYNHWAAQGAQTMEGGEFGTRAGMQPEDDLGVAAEAYRNRPVRGRRGLILASVAGLAVLIGGIGYHFLGGSGSGEPVVIRADNQPIKMQPENPGGATVPNQDKAVYDRVAGTLPNNPEQKSLISAGEEPVDLGAQDNEVGTDDSPEPNLAGTTPSQSGQDSPLIQPREVETMIVRPDGSIVQAQQPAQTAPQQTAPVASANNDAPIAPPAETDEIAALAAGGELKQPVANTPATQPVTQTPVTPVRAPVVPSRPAEQPTTIVGNVPQRTQAPAQAAVAAPQVASAAGGGYFIQIASQPSAELAQKSYANMAQRYGSVIGGRAVDIKRADIPNKGTYYRVRVQAGSKEEANALCGRFKTAGGSCFVTQ